jgi:4-amino-4-deoxy-L-arabinose transferase-like glycosyltransferase
MSGVSGRLAALWLTLVIGTYLLVGVLFAVYTPDWQAPDEPAHYNYVRYLAEQGRFPVLQQGDYPQDYLEEIKSQKFPAHLPIDPIRYEFHQPPLYYLLATPVFKLFDGALLPLRLLSVILGGGLVYVAYRLALAVCPTQPVLALGAAAFVAFVPMHVAMAAAVNNDTLAELLLALALWGGVRYLRGEIKDKKTLAVVGSLLGLGLLTKIYALIAVAVAVAAVALRRRRDLRRAVSDLAWLLVPVLVFALPWLARNVAVYGWPDVMGLARHDAVVEGQPTTAEWIADYGWRYLIGQGVRTTYRSFWGKFGWMAVLMDRRIYLALSLFAAVATAGFIWWLVSAWVSFRRSGQAGILNSSKDATSARPRPLTSSGCLGAPAVLLLFSVLLTFISYLWYNTKFVQHQGRYLFPALVPLSLALALGWWTIVRRAGALVARTAWPARVNGLLFASPYAGLAVLDVVCLFAFVVPYLS